MFFAFFVSASCDKECDMCKELFDNATAEYNKTQKVDLFYSSKEEVCKSYEAPLNDSCIILFDAINKKAGKGRLNKYTTHDFCFYQAFCDDVYDNDDENDDGSILGKVKAQIRKLMLKLVDKIIRSILSIEKGKYANFEALRDEF